VSEIAAKLRRGLRTVLRMGIWGGGLFLGAGTFDWARGWISLAAYCTAMAIVGVVVSRKNPGLISERDKWRRKDTKGFDRIFLAALMPLTILQPVVAGMDAVRFGWLPVGPVWLLPGLILFALGMGLIGWVLAVNRHAETTVRIQTDRGHQVVTTGPYRFVRHPMYAGVLLIYAGTPLMWGSGAAMWVSLALIALFIWRTVEEDRTHRRELPGYIAYSACTRYRMIPGLW
jgi:protein-S-isoprenylcysteine O-methyltransferase Ste14